MSPLFSLILLKVVLVGAALAFAVRELLALRRLKRKNAEARDAADADGAS